MAIEPVPYIDPAPVPGPQRGDEATFDERMDAKILWDETSAQQFADLADNVVHNAGEAAGSATTAQTHAISSQNYAGAAQVSASDAADSAEASNQSATNSANSATAAQQSAVASAASAVSLTANSSTSFAVGNGAKVFTVPTGKQFPPGEPLTIASTGTPALKMFGAVASYVGPSLTVNVTGFEGVGTAADWVIVPGGAVGPAGGLTGGNMTSAINEKKGADLASAGTIDPWASVGNQMPLIGNAVVTAIAPAPQPGAKRTLNVKGPSTITSNASILVKGGTTFLAAGDALDIEAETTTTFLVTVRRGDGSATAATLFRHSIFIENSSVWVAPRDGLVRFYAKGSDGSGGVSVGNGAAGACITASGGSAAGLAIKTVYARTGDSYSINTGARAAGVSNAGNTGVAVPGVNGGVTTVSGPGVNITCNGGLGGNATLSLPGVGAAVALGVAGGTATGGDFNYTGGDSGTATATSATVSAGAATGGGSFGYKGNAPKSGDATVTYSGGVAAYAASGGAGVGGNSGNAIASGTSSAMYSPTAGAGSIGPSTANSTGVLNLAGGPGMPAPVTQTPLTLNGAGSAALGSTTGVGTPVVPGDGAGSGAWILSNATGLNATGAPITFAAGGAIAGRWDTSSLVGGAADYGGGSGGIAVRAGSSTVISGAAGKAFVLIEYN